MAPVKAYEFPLHHQEHRAQLVLTTHALDGAQPPCDSPILKMNYLSNLLKITELVGREPALPQSLTLTPSPCAM